MWARATPVIVALGLAIAPARAVAGEKRTATLEYVRDAGAQCPDARRMGDAVAERLGYDPFTPDGAARIRIEMGREDGRWTARIALYDVSGALVGRRELESRDEGCAELASTAALALAVLLDPHALLGPAPAAPVPAPSPAAPTRAEDPFAEPPAPPPPVPHAEPVRAYAGLGPLASVGAAPAPALGLEAFLGLRRGAFGLDVGGRVDLPTSTRADTGESVTSSLILGALAPCYRPGILMFCALFAAGALHGEGTTAGARHVTEPYVALGARGGLEAPLESAVALRVHADVLAPMTRTTLGVGPVDVWTTPALSVAAGAAAVVHFR